MHADECRSALAAEEFVSVARPCRAGKELDPSDLTGAHLRPIPLLQTLVLLLTLCCAPLGAESVSGAQLPQAVSERTADQQYADARSLAAGGRRSEAAAAFEAGERLAPGDARFPTELAGIAFLDERYADARKHLKRALRLAPDDPYLIDFLATVYLLEGNLDAAVLYWNRIGKPRVEQVRVDTSGGGDGVLLDRALAFAPASTLRSADLELTRARLEQLGFHAQYRLDLLAREDQDYDLHFQALERAAWSDSKLGAAVSLLRGLPYQTVHAEFFDVDGRGLNVESMARWDPRKKRLNIAAARPVGRDPGRRLEFFLDARDEDWRFDSVSLDSVGSDAAGLDSAGTAAVRRGFTMQKAEAGFRYAAIPNRWLTWRTGVTIASRSFRDRALDSAGTSADADDLYRAGPSLNSTFGLGLRLLRLPERRLTLDGAADWRIGRFWAGDATLYSRWTQSLTLRWFPQASGDDYAVETRWRSGQTFGAAPFDELYALGLDRDGDLWLRGHRGTAGGYKGSALLGGRYLLWNSELDKIVYRHAFLKLTAGPFLDAGTMHDSRGWFGSSGWRWDAGVQAKAALTGGLVVAFSYGRNLQSGRAAFFWRIVRR
jgi:tetratricopeptide (TPR) repeat protein